MECCKHALKLIAPHWAIANFHRQWIGNMQNANECLGFLHGAYGLGATLAPLIATTMVTKGKLQWYTFYYVMVS
jgi:fucose permease